MNANKKRTKVFYTGIENVYPAISCLKKRKEQREDIKQCMITHFYTTNKMRWSSWNVCDNSYDFLFESITDINNL